MLAYRNGKLVEVRWWEGFLSLGIFIGAGLSFAGSTAIRFHFPVWHPVPSWFCSIGGALLAFCCLQISTKKGIL